MVEITDKVLRKMLDKAGLKDVRLFKHEGWIYTKNGEKRVSANKMNFSDITRGQWAGTIKHWIETGEK